MIGSNQLFLAVFFAELFFAAQYAFILSACCLR